MPHLTETNGLSESSRRVDIHLSSSYTSSAWGVARKVSSPQYQNLPEIAFRVPEKQFRLSGIVWKTISTVTILLYLAILLIIDSKESNVGIDRAIINIDTNIEDLITLNSFVENGRDAVKFLCLMNLILPIGKNYFQSHIVDVIGQYQKSKSSRLGVVYSCQKRQYMVWSNMCKCGCIE